MPVLGQRAFILTPQTDKFVSLAGEEFTRRIDLTGFGNGWSKVRIAINYAIMNTGGGNITNTELFIGMCSGTTFPYQSQQCVNACGYMWGTTGGGTWTYNAGAGNPYYSTSQFYGVRKVGAGTLIASIGSSTYYHPTIGGSIARRGWMGISLRQTATQVILNGYTEAAATCASDVWLEHFLYATNQGGYGGAPYVLETMCPTNAQTLTPGAGWNTNNLNAVDIWWSNATYSLDIYAIACAFTN